LIINNNRKRRKVHLSYDVQLSKNIELAVLDFWSLKTQASHHSPRQISYYIKVPDFTSFRFPASSIVGLGLGLVVGLGTVLVLFFHCIFHLSDSDVC